MEHAELLEVLRQLVHYASSGTTASHPDGARRNPTSNYTDAQQFELEKQRIFSRAPQLICLSGDLPEPGSYRTHDDTGVPMVVVRQADGGVRAFVNACAHRAARLVSGSGRLPQGGFVCPYHAWRYGLDGALQAVFKAQSFGPIAAQDYGLQPLPCEEKHGLIYAAPDPEAGFSVDEHLGELGPELGGWRLGEATRIQSGEWRLPTNWKLALDTFCEGYHFGPLHAKTVGQFSLTNCMSYDRYGKHGEHHRLGFPSKAVLGLAHKPESEWGDPFQYFSFVHYIYPNISLLVSQDEVEFFQLFPGETVGEHITRYTLYLRKPVDSEERREHGRQHFDYIYSVVDQEDYWVSAQVQKNLNSGMQRWTTFGRNEPSLINMHRTLRRMAGLPLVDEPAEPGAAA
ncbi:MAG: aromatic ring-hydroxylating dioxygenase subunit alpha [Deltaproteobacteria bacterium]|nr:aromatic ring-hydroxylating dioxygenase subunit alpha [Deltaproteobacteria bacterium]MDD9826976.1 aromatic ring-hydroxylating dioxygenase subunit alpha [Deltaproteobacteria bacterium]MDD9854245.1 aromatic ring-hydroxylating dioxygenase subunit alpha [Deltaproteobacteria bacterium]